MNGRDGSPLGSAHEQRLPHADGADRPSRRIGNNSGGVALVCGFKYLASEKSREPVGGDAAQALATCPDSAVAIRIGTTEMDNAIAIDNDTLRMGEATRTLTGDHESRVTDTGTSIVQSAGCLNPGDPMTLRVYGEDGANPTLLNGGTGGTIRQGVLVSPVVAIDGNKLCKNERAGGSGLGVSTDGVMYTETACDNHAVAVRTANTHANGHGFAEEATHTLDRASGQAVAIGNPWDTQSQQVLMSANGVVPPLAANGKTERRHEGADRRAVVIGCDRRNQSGADEVQPALQSTVSDGGSTVAVGINSPQPHSTTRGFGNEVQPTFGAAAGESGNNKPMVALNHIVRRLTPVECERLQGFPDGWTRIPYRGRPAEECPDSPRYRALGNSWATNCAEYILRRIVAAFRLDMVPDNN